MAEEIEKPVTETAAASNITAENVSAAEAFTHDVNAVAEFLSPKMIAELEAERKNLLAAKTEKQTDKKPVDENTVLETEEQKAAKADLATKEAADKKAAEEKKVADTNERKSVLGIGKKKDTKSIDIVIENESQILDVVKSKFGIEAKEIKDLPKFFESAQKWRVASQELESVKKESTDLKNLIVEMPTEFHDAIKLHYSGKDYMKAFEAKPKFDFNVPAEKQDVKALVNHYFPNKFTDDDFKEETKSPALDIATTAAIDKFNTEKTARDTQRTQYLDRAQKQLEAQKSSVKSSVERLSQSFPDVDQDVLNDIQDILEGGKEKVMSVFFNNDGTVKQEAAEYLMMAKHGKSEIETMMGIAGNIAESRANEEIVTKGADKPKPVKSTGSKDELPKELQDKINELKSIKQKTTF